MNAKERRNARRAAAIAADEASPDTVLADRYTRNPRPVDGLVSHSWTTATSVRVTDRGSAQMGRDKATATDRRWDQLV